MSEAVQVAVGVLALVTGVTGLIGACVRWLHRHIREDITTAIDKRIEPLDSKITSQGRTLEQIRHEVTYDSGTSLKDGVRAIARHVGIDIEEGPFVTILDPDAPTRKRHDI